MLIWTCTNGYTDVVRLVDQGVDLNAQGSFRLFLHAKLYADIAQDPAGRTALKWDCANGHLSAAEMMVDGGVDCCHSLQSSFNAQAQLAEPRRLTILSWVTSGLGAFTSEGL